MKSSIAVQLDVFAVPTRVIRPMLHTDPSEEEQEAAVRVLPKVSALQQQVLWLLATAGPLNDRELETRIAGHAPSTVRKRRSELFQNGAVQKVGTKDGLALWAIARGGA